MGGCPNIVFIMTDQQRWDALGCENSLIQTPHLDRLARTGVRLRQATCNAPMCVPSRYSLMTGLYPSQLGIRHNTQFAPKDDLLPVPVIPELMRDAGYQTLGVGKTHWYLGSGRDGHLDVRPSRRGFELRAKIAPDDPHLAEPGARLFGVDRPDLLDALQRETADFGGGGEGVSGYRGLTSTRSTEDHPEAWLARQADDFVTNHRDPSRPLFLYFSLDAPHPGFAVPAEFEDQYDVRDIPDLDVPEQLAGKGSVEHAFVRHALVDEWQAMRPIERRRTTLRYWALTTFADAMIGRVLERLNELGELENALIVFASDHGEMLGDRGYRFSKYCLYESSVRVPLILSGACVPSSLRGTVNDEPAELVDIMPTVLEAAGCDVPEFLPGRNLLSGEPPRASFAEYHGSGYERQRGDLALMWRTPREKLILHLSGALGRPALAGATRQGELYDLERDPGELENRFHDAAMRERRLALTEDLVLHLASTWARYPSLPSLREEREIHPC